MTTVSFDLARFLENPFCMIRREGTDHVLLFQGSIVNHDRLDRIAVKPKTAAPGQENFATINYLPFAQARERGFAVHDEGEKIASLVIDKTTQIPVADLLTQIGGDAVTLADPGGFGESDADYAALVQTIIDEDIGNGEGANFVIPRWYRAQIADYTPRKALAAFAHLLREERGTYWTFIIFDGHEFLVGATPERHISLQNGLVKMNPISGTLRKAELDPARLREQLLDFINDKKEIFELLMVVDEELKMIADFCPAGGQVVGPLLKEMAHLVHSEYLLAGPTGMGVIDLLRGSMFAATVTGSPIESAFRVIKKREPGSRHYYGSMLALIGEDSDGKPTLDAPILIRTAHIDAAGNIAAGVGATIVFHSKPEDEVKETYAKAAGLMRAFGLPSAKIAKPGIALQDLIASEEIQLALNLRNKDLSRFWIDYQSDDFTLDTSLAGKSALIVDNEDNFTHMFAHMLRRLGMQVRIMSFKDVANIAQEAVDLVVIGPGPGDPNNMQDAKMVKNRAMIEALKDAGRKFLCICLGHQILCNVLGLKVAKKQPAAFQGRQEVIDYFGRKQRVGFYNTFVGHYKAAISGIQFCHDPQSGDIHALRHTQFGGLQFHAESILTTNGLQIIQDEMARLLSGR